MDPRWLPGMLQMWAYSKAAERSAVVAPTRPADPLQVAFLAAVSTAKLRTAGTVGTVVSDKKLGAKMQLFFLTLKQPLWKLSSAKYFLAANDLNSSLYPITFQHAARVCQ